MDPHRMGFPRTRPRRRELRAMGNVVAFVILLATVAALAYWLKGA